MKGLSLPQTLDSVALDRISSAGVAEPVAAFWSAAARGGSGWALVSAGLGALGGNYRRAGLDGLAAWSAAEAAAAAIKTATSRSRPRRPRGRSGASSSSFPSSHSAAGVAYAVAAGARAPALALPLGVAALAVAWSRMEKRLHYPSDVLAGTALGVTVGGGVAALSRRR